MGKFVYEILPQALHKTTTAIQAFLLLLYLIAKVRNHLTIVHSGKPLFTFSCDPRDPRCSLCIGAGHHLWI